MTCRSRSITKLIQICHGLIVGEMAPIPPFSWFLPLKDTAPFSSQGANRWESGKPCLKPQEFLKRIAIKDSTATDRGFSQS
jgi:hypothetical protein